jgi:hypothetical protein
MQPVQFEKIELYQLHFFILSIPVLERGDIYIMPDVNTVITENGTEVYENGIYLYLDQYIEEHNVEDMHKEPQSRWNAALLYINKNLFKLHPEILKSENRVSNTYDINIINTICDIYIELCYEYDKEVSILGFCKLTGIVQDTIYQWGNETTRLGSSASEIYKKLSTEREESLSNMLISGKRNPVGLLGALNRHYGWNMGQPRGGITEKHQSIEQIQQRYKPAELSVNDTQLAPPKADF